MKRFAPAFFVLLWSTGFIVARYATRDAGALSFLTVRTAIAAVVLGTVAVIMKETAVTGRQRRVMMAVGLGMHAMYLGGVFFAIEHGMPSGMSSLIAAMHPVVTTVFAWVVLGEKLNRIRTLGVCLGVAGVVFVVIEHGGTGDGVSAPAMWAMVVAVVGMSSGTLVQRQLGQGTPLLRGTAWQYASTTVALGLVAVFGEGWRFEMTANTLWSLAWAVGVLSIAAILIMLWLLHRQAASQVSSLFFLTPALSSVEAAVLFGEKLGGLAVLGLGVALVGVFLATNQRFVSAPQP
ncbi:MAG: hypothetical protein RL430_1407 [Actinomycetota bacterium]